MSKDKTSEELARDLQAFKQKGGEVQTVSNGESALTKMPGEHRVRRIDMALILPQRKKRENNRE